MQTLEHFINFKSIKMLCYLYTAVTTSFSYEKPGMAGRAGSRGFQFYYFWGESLLICL